MVMLNLASIHVDMDEVKNLKILKLFLTAKWLMNSKKKYIITIYLEIKLIIFMY